MSDTELLARILRRNHGAETASLLAGLNEAGWARLVDAAIWHGVGSLLHVRLAGPSREHLPDSQAQRLRDQYAHSVLHNVAIRDQLQELLEEAEVAGCRIAVLKGAYLANCVYEDPGARTMWDIDALVPHQDIERFRDHLLGRGYERTEYFEGLDLYHHLSPMRTDGGVPLELHRHLVPDRAIFQIEVDGVWSRVTSTAGHGLELPHLAPDDVIIHVCVHTAYHHRFMVGLRGACDVDVLVRRLGNSVDWSRLVDTANADGSAPYVYAALRVAQELLQTPIPEHVLSALEHEQCEERMVGDALAFVTNMEEERTPAAFRELRESSSLMTGVRVLWRGIFPTPEVIRHVYSIERGSLRLPLYYVVRPFDLLRRRGARWVGLVTGAERERRMVDKDERLQRITEWARRSRPGVAEDR